jgi:DNA-directed RNA polymerase delta subunit
MPSPDARLNHAADLLASEIDGEIVMMDVESGNYLNFDAVATDIWNRIGAGIRFDDLCAAIAGAYDADSATITRDVAEFVNDLITRGLVRVEP